MKPSAADACGWSRRTTELAAAAYRRAGRFAWHFARGKLRHDPLFTGLLRLGLIPSDARVVDLGCGQGLLSAWLHAAAARFDAGDWPAGWPRPPRGLRLRGVELMRRDVERARAALGDQADFVHGDMRAADLAGADAVTLFDVLHYIDLAEQDALLRRVHAGLPPGGVLLLRIGDADGGWRFRCSAWVDRLATRMRGHKAPPVHCRGLREWAALLTRLGFDIRIIPMSEGVPFANVLVQAVKPPRLVSTAASLQ